MIESTLKRGISIVKKTVENAPNSPGVYKMMSDDDTILYVGKAKSLPKRIISYSLVEKLPYRLKMMVSQIKKIEYLVTETEAQALLLEANLINTIQPKYNIQLKDDKSFPYIAIEQDHQFPRISKHRGNLNKKNKYYGPFASVQAVNYAIAEIQKTFKIRPCSNSYFSSRTRPCLQWQLKRCSAPCVNKISVEDYKNDLIQAQNFLEGKNIKLQDLLKEQMAKASDNLEYEKAAEIRDRIKTLNQIQARNVTVTGALSDADIFALYCDEYENCCIEVFFIRNGKNFGNTSYFIEQQEHPDQIIESFLLQFYQKNPPPTVIVLSNTPKDKKPLQTALNSLHESSIKIINYKNSTALKDLMDFALENAKQSLSKKLLDEHLNNVNLAMLQKTFELRNLPRLIEIYDNSHLQGSHAFGCYVAALDGKLNKKLYRTFKISNKQITSDDYAMLSETLTRRFKNLKNTKRPNLLIIDGGKGQLSCTLNTLDKLGWDDVEVICMSKGPDRNSGREFFHMKNKPSFQLPVGDKTLAYLHTLRNEAHRFAITTHRKSFSKSLSISKIDDIPNIGKSRKIALLHHFGSIESLKNASINDLARTPGIGKKIATIVVSYLHSSTNG